MEPPPRPAVAEVSVWHADLDVTASLPALEATLSDDERARAARFVFVRDRRRFVAARGVLRRILGSLLDLEPARVRFEYGERGKPRLSAAQGEGQLRFNLAHSQGHGLFALTSGAEIGADIEVLRPLPDAMAIAERFFSPAERAQLLARPVSERQAAFFHCWTRKEAYIKALGTGLGHPLDSFSVSLEPGGPLRLLDHAAAGEADAWSLHDLSCLPTYAAAIAVRTGGAAPHLSVSEIELESDGTAPRARP